MIPVFRRLIINKRSFLYSRRHIYVLGIESSCDDTSAAIVNEDGKILGEGHFSQFRIHLEAGGIIPSLAGSLHKQHLKNVVDTSVSQSQIHYKDLDAIAVTVKPGLQIALKAGLDYAKNLATLHSRPVIPIHHMEAHALTARMIENITFPFLVLLISGGHCILALVKSVDKFYTLGSSVDDSPGRALDFIARRAKLKNLKQFKALVGGAAIEAAAKNGDSSKFPFSRSVLLQHGKTCNFSFSAFLSAARHHLENEETKHNLQPDEVTPNITDFCASALMSLSVHICQRLEVALNYINIKGLLGESKKCLVMSGGVACNKFIQKSVKIICDHYDYKLVVPPAKLCTDNGVMIAWNGIERLKASLPVIQPENLSSVTEIAKCPLGEDISNEVNEVSKLMDFKFIKLKNYAHVDSLSPSG